jgi:sulfotransferase family protein
MTTANSPTTPAPVRIDDLAEPRFPAPYDEMLAGMAAMAPSCPLEPEPLMEAAVAAAGLDDFGDPRFREALDVLTRSFRTEANLSPAGTVATHTQLVQLLVNRLRLGDLLRRHPEIHDVPVPAPIVIAGLPRTGTTHLHNLLAADPALRELPYWEAVEPFPAPGDTREDRMARTEASLEVVNGVMPHFRRMHEMTVDHAHEEIHLLAIDLSTMLFETLALLPSYRDWYRSTDQTPAYRTMRTCLQALTWLDEQGGHAPRRWVLKSPQHLEQFGPLTAAFPDATVVVTHRDPVSVMASMVTMLTYTARMHVERPDPAAYGAYWSARLDDMLAACTRDRELLPEARSVDVRFDDLMADELGTVAHIYRLAGQPLDEPAQAAMTSYLASHQRNRHGQVIYDLADFGLDADEQREALRPYRERFGV